MGFKQKLRPGPMPANRYLAVIEGVQATICFAEQENPHIMEAIKSLLTAAYRAKLQTPD